MFRVPGTPERIQSAIDELVSIAEFTAARANGAKDGALASLALVIADAASRIHAALEDFLSPPNQP